MKVKTVPVTNKLKQLLQYDLWHYQTLDDYLNAVVQKATCFVPNQIIIGSAAFKLNAPALTELINAFADLAYQERYMLSQAASWQLVPSAINDQYDLVLSLQLGDYLQTLLLAAPDSEIRAKIDTLLTLRAKLETVMPNATEMTNSLAANQDQALNNSATVSGEQTANGTDNNTTAPDNEADNMNATNTAAPDNESDDMNTTNTSPDNEADDMNTTNTTSPDTVADTTNEAVNATAQNESTINEPENANDPKALSQMAPSSNAAAPSESTPRKNALLNEIEHNYDGDGVEADPDDDNVLDFDSLLKTVSTLLQHFQQGQQEPAAPARTTNAAPKMAAADNAVQTSLADFYHQQDQMVLQALPAINQ